MGKVATQELDNGNIGVEITYGGLDSPYGGVDSSAPPAYIDPRCFTDSDGFLVVNNRLVAVAFERVSVPTLWGGDTAVKLLKFGTFYNSIDGLKNYALGYKATAFAGPPSGVNYEFIITAWNPENIALFNTDSFVFTLYDADSVATAASITIGLISTNSTAPATGSGASGNITAVDAYGRVLTYTVTSGGTGYGVDDVVQVIGTPGGPTMYEDAWIQVTSVGGGGDITGSTLFNPGTGFATGPWTAGEDEASSGVHIRVVSTSGTNDYNVKSWVSGYTKQQVVAALVNEFVLTPNPDVNATASVDGQSLILTAKIAGAAGNAFTVRDLSTNHDPTKPPPLYFACRTAQNFIGGADATSSGFQALRTIPTPISAAAVGGTIYFAGLGPFILKYSTPGNFYVSTFEKGMGVIRKFAGSLIGLRDVPQLGEILQNQDMIFAWSSPTQLDIWEPLDQDGNVTGAGFQQLADIDDYLSGLIVTAGTAFIIRAQGVSYATPTGNATLPFAISHMSLGDQGEGSQTSALVCQYDAVGAFIGNTDIFQVSGAIKSIGKFIKTAIFQALQSAQSFLDSNACSTYLGGETFPIVVFLIDGALYLFNVLNGTWMVMNIPSFNTFARMLLGTFSSENTLASDDQFQQASMTLATQASGALPLFYTLQEVVRKTTSISDSSDLFFVAEELLFGRDVTVDALYISLNAQLVADATIEFWISGQLFSTLTLAHASYTNINAAPTEIQVFPSTTTDTTAVFTAHSPQLEIKITSLNSSNNLIRFVKIQLYGSFDPKQRPV